MKPIEMILQCYAFGPMDQTTMNAMEYHLNELYPEAEWKVVYDSECENNIPRVTVKFKSEEDRIFYTLKWS